MPGSRYIRPVNGFSVRAVCIFLNLRQSLDTSHRQEDSNLSHLPARNRALTTLSHPYRDYLLSVSIRLPLFTRHISLGTGFEPASPRLFTSDALPLSDPRDDCCLCLYLQSTLPMQLLLPPCAGRGPYGRPSVLLHVLLWFYGTVTEWI